MIRNKMIMLSISLLIMVAGSYLFISRLGWAAWLGLILIMLSYTIDKRISGA